MTTEHLAKLHSARPFVPFDMNLADGRTLTVSHPEMLARAKRHVALVYDSDEAFDIVDLLLVTSLSCPSKSTVKNGKKKR